MPKSQLAPALGAGAHLCRQYRVLGEGGVINTTRPVLWRITSAFEAQMEERGHSILSNSVVLGRSK